MDGPSHFVTAEQLLEQADDLNANSAGHQSLIAQAQVHATLALAAATAHAACADRHEFRDFWIDAIG